MSRHAHKTGPWYILGVLFSLALPQTYARLIVESKQNLWRLMASIYFFIFILSCLYYFKLVNVIPKMHYPSGRTWTNICSWSGYASPV